MKTAELSDCGAPSGTDRVLLQSALLNPGRLLVEMAASFRPEAASKGLEFRTEPYPDWHDVIIDDALVRQIVGLLLSDAIEHTSAGWVRLTATPPDGAHWGIIIEGAAPPETDGDFGAGQRAPDGVDWPGAEDGMLVCKALEHFKFSCSHSTPPRQ